MARPKRPYTAVLTILVTAVLYAAANELAQEAQIVPGVSILFPATAVAIAAIIHFGPAAALGICIGTILTPWGSKGGVGAMIAYYGPMGLINVAEGAIPALILRRIRGFSYQMDRARNILLFLLFGTLLNTAFSALTGNLVRSAASNTALSWTDIRIWWLADGIAALTWGMALTILIERIKTRSFPLGPGSEWTRRDRTRIPMLLLLFGVATYLYYLATLHGIGGYRVFAVLYLLPLLWATWSYGVCGGTLMNGLISATYVYITCSMVRHSAGPYPRIDLYEQMIPIYLFLFIFAAFALFAGHLADIKRNLLHAYSARTKQVERMLDSTLLTLSAAIEAKDPCTQDHVRRVERLSVQIARRLGVSNEEIPAIRYAAILHDVGKIGIPESILNKAGSLTDEEFAIMKRHVAIGVKIIREVPGLDDVIPLVEHHQERWDGDTAHPEHPAYPEGLSGEAIPLGSRIIAVVDAYDAMTSDRAYRRAVPIAEARAELVREAGFQFDPRVVHVLLQILDEEEAHRSEMASGSPQQIRRGATA